MGCAVSLPYSSCAPSGSSSRVRAVFYVSLTIVIGARGLAMGKQPVQATVACGVAIIDRVVPEDNPDQIVVSNDSHSIHYASHCRSPGTPADVRLVTVSTYVQSLVRWSAPAVQCAAGRTGRIARPSRPHRVFPGRADNAYDIAPGYYWA